MKKYPLLAYFGHHKCATTWINIINAEFCEKAGLKFAIVHNPDMFDHDLLVKLNYETDLNWDGKI